MINANKELQRRLLEIYGNNFVSEILAAEIIYGDKDYDEDNDEFESKHINLPVVSEPYSLEQVHYFLDSLDFEYPNGYGLQYLYGTVWMKDGSWLERKEYDGSEWWVCKKTPKIPEHLFKK
ncbi:MAG TPA: hypothetical protein DCY51_06890 [Bacteroidetes bacterium]|nr:hypothetical protein [Bacteroidota bacterium]